MFFSFIRFFISSAPSRLFFGNLCQQKYSTTHTTALSILPVLQYGYINGTIENGISGYFKESYPALFAFPCLRPKLTRCKKGRNPEKAPIRRYSARQGLYNVRSTKRSISLAGTEPSSPNTNGHLPVSSIIKPISMPKCVCRCRNCAKINVNRVYSQPSGFQAALHP